MLPLRRFVKLVRNGKLEDIKHLRLKLKDYGEAGVMELCGVLENPTTSSHAKSMALFVLDTNRTQPPDGNPRIMEAVERLAGTPDPESDLDLICFMTVYANAIKLRAESIRLVERFRVGTDRQRMIYNEVDSEFTRKASQMDYLRRMVAAGKGGLK